MIILSYFLCTFYNSSTAFLSCTDHNFLKVSKRHFQDLFSELNMAVLSLVACNPCSCYSFLRFIALHLLKNIFLHWKHVVTLFCEVPLKFCAINMLLGCLKIFHINIEHSIGKTVCSQGALSYWPRADGQKTHMLCFFKTILWCRASKICLQQLHLTQLLEYSAQKQLHLSSLLSTQPEKIKLWLCNLTQTLLIYDIM